MARLCVATNFVQDCVPGITGYCRYCRTSMLVDPRYIAMALTPVATSDIKRNALEAEIRSLRAMNDQLSVVLNEERRALIAEQAKSAALQKQVDEYIKKLPAPIPPLTGVRPIELD